MRGSVFVWETGLEGLENSQNPQNQWFLSRNKVLPKSKINILTVPQNPKTNSLEMPEFQTKFCSFSLCFMGFLMREMGFGEVKEYGRKKTPLTRSGGENYLNKIVLYRKMSMLAIKWIIPNPKKKPVNALFVLVETILAKNWIPPSSIKGIRKMEHNQIGSKVLNIIRKKAKQYPQAIPVQRAHKGNWYPLTKKLLSGSWWQHQNCFVKDINLPQIFSFLFITL